MEYSIIDRTQILSRLGLKEIPLPKTIEYVYYYITYNSCWYNDYLTRYFPNSYFSILLFETEIMNEEMKEQIISAAIIEYKKLKRYIYHVYEKNIQPDINPVIYEHTNKNTFTTNRYILNKFLDNIENIKEVKKILSDNKNELIVLETRQKLYFSNSKPCLNKEPINDIFDVEMKLINLEKQIINLEKQKKYLISRKLNYYETEANKDLLNKLQNINNLYIRTLEFNIETIKNIPDDVLDIIRAYIGEAFIEHVRQYNITEKYFQIENANTEQDISSSEINRNLYPNPSYHIKYNIEELLKKWRIVDLQSYAKQTFIRYDIDNNQSFRWRRRSLRTTISKTEAIRFILRGTHKHSFYEFQRDIIILSRILSENKIIRRRLTKEKNNISIIT
jgi:beta-lactamase class D